MKRDAPMPRKTPNRSAQPMSRVNLVLNVWLCFLVALGLLLGAAIAAHPRLETFKLLNILGLTLDLLGLVVLSEFVVASERWKSFVVKWVAGVLLWAQTVVPLAAAAGAALSSSAPSSLKASVFFVSLFAYSLVPLALLDHTVFYPSRWDAADKTQRTRRFGLLLLISGVLVQLAAAFQDLYA